MEQNNDQTVISLQDEIAATVMDKLERQFRQSRPKKEVEADRKIKRTVRKEVRDAVRKEVSGLRRRLMDAEGRDTSDLPALPDKRREKRKVERRRFVEDTDGDVAPQPAPTGAVLVSSPLFSPDKHEVCSKCKYGFLRAHYSGHQLRKGRRAQKCQKCTAEDHAAHRPPSKEELLYDYYYPRTGSRFEVLRDYWG
jgi:hypothetical protein